MALKPNPIYPTTARYLVTAPAYINDTLLAASEDGKPVYVDYDGHPGTALEPTDKEGERRKAAYFASKRLTAAQADEQKRRLTEGAYDPGVLAVPAGSAPPSVLGRTALFPPPPAVVEIPDGWANTMNAGERVLLAHRLGAPESITTASAANDFIRGEMDRRAKA